jgi:hypothetical protein
MCIILTERLAPLHTVHRRILQPMRAKPHFLALRVSCQGAICTMTTSRATGDVIKIAASKPPRFAAGATLKAAAKEKVIRLAA